MTHKIITLCFWKRPDYATAVLESLRKCKGIENYKLLIHLDGCGNPEMPYVACAVDFCERIIVKRADHLGCNDMTRIALHHGFSHSDYVIHVEEDVVLAPDALQYFEWAERFVTDANIFTASGWRHPSGWLPESRKPYDSEMGGEARIEPFFTCWGWATWSDRWKEMDTHWTTGTDLSLSWDIAISGTRGNRCEVHPMISRAMNIGEHGGVHRGSSMLSYWAGSPGFNPVRDYTLL